MTTPQSGREAFEAWAEREFGKVPGSLPATERFASYWKCWQAALAQQGREVGEPGSVWQIRFLSPVSGNWSGWIGVESEAEALRMLGGLKLLGMTAEHRALYTAAPKQQAVDEAMVDRAWKAATLACVVKGRYRAPVAPNEWFAALRAALLAALPGKTEVE